MRVLCKRCAYITHAHIQTHVNGKLEEKFYASTEREPEKNKENRFAHGKCGRKNYVMERALDSHWSVIYRFCTFS